MEVISTYLEMERIIYREKRKKPCEYKRKEEKGKKECIIKMQVIKIMWKQQ